MTRIAQHLVQALFGLNKEYFVCDEYANRLIDQLSSRPHDFTYEDFKPRTIWSLSKKFTSAFKELDPIPQFTVTAKLGEFLEARFSRRET